MSNTSSKRRPLSKCAAGLALVGASLLACNQKGTTPAATTPVATAKATAEQSTFASASAFSGAGTTLNGVNVTPSGQVQINQGLSEYQTPYIWVPNSDDQTISQINTKTLQFVGSASYPLIGPSGESCNSPSRTVVDLQGDAWVGCRGSVTTTSPVNGVNSYTQRNYVVAADVPVYVDHKILKVSHVDGHVMLELNVGLAPRGFAIDAKGNIWVAMSADNTVWEFDETTGACLRGDPNDFLGNATQCAQPAVQVGIFPYGAAVDQRGHLWTVNRDPGVATPGPVNTVSEVDTETGALIKTYGPWPRKCQSTSNNVYGIAIDQLNNIWISGWTCHDIFALKGPAGVSPITGQTYNPGDLIVNYTAASGGSAFGIAVDGAGDLWVAVANDDSSQPGLAVKIASSSGAIISSVQVGKNPTGVGVDAYGNAWAVNRYDNNLTLINGLDTTKTQTIPVGNGPYTYSDMLGTALRNITLANGSAVYWRGLIDSGQTNPVWQSIQWQAAVPSPTSLQAKIRCAATTQALDVTDFGPAVLQPGPISCGSGSGRYAEVEVDFMQNGSTNSPVLQALSVTWKNP